MIIEFTTTITHKIELGGPTGVKNITHDVGIVAEQDAAALGPAALYVVVHAGAKALIQAIENGEGKVVIENG